MQFKVFQQIVCEILLETKANPYVLFDLNIFLAKTNWAKQNQSSAADVLRFIQQNKRLNRLFFFSKVNESHFERVLFENCIGMIEREL